MRAGVSVSDAWQLHGEAMTRALMGRAQGLRTHVKRSHRGARVDCVSGRVDDEEVRREWRLGAADIEAIRLM